MDAEHFETLLRSLTTAPSRRTMLRLLAGSTLGSLVAAGVQPSQAKRRGKGKRKRKKRNDQNPTPSAPVECPPVCPLCQGCDARTGLCFAHPGQQGLPAPGCDAPKVCCSAACCDPIHACNSAGTCATCAEVCPDTCLFCVSLADGGTVCSVSVTCNPNAPSCTTTDDCPDEWQCATSITARDSNETYQNCGKPVGTGVCYSIHPCS